MAGKFLKVYLNHDHSPTVGFNDKTKHAFLVPVDCIILCCVSSGSKHLLLCFSARHCSHGE